MSERPWEEEAQRLLKRTFAQLEAGSNLSSRAGLLQIAPALTGEEAKHFVLGLESGLFEIDEQGCSRDSFGSASRVGGDASPLRVFSEDRSRLVREAVCQLSTAAALVLDRGWLPRQVEVVSSPACHEATICGVDIVLRSLSGTLLAAMAVKRTAPELEKLARDFHQCGKRGKHSLDNCGFPQNHGKWEFCMVHHPIYFRGVAPGGEICFKVQYHGELMELDDVGSLPPRSIVEIADKLRDEDSSQS